MTNTQLLDEWFERGLKQGAKYMLVICDTFDYEDYPSYADTAKECMAKYREPGEMQKVMEVYDLRDDKQEQMNESRVLRLPSQLW